MRKKDIATFSVVILFFSSFILIFSAGNVNASESIVYVDDSNTNGPWSGTQGHPFLKIQDGIDGVSTGGVVHVLNGTYQENIFINKTVEIIGNSRGNVIVDGLEFGDAILISAGNVTVHYLTVESSTYGIRISASSNCIIKDNNIRDNEYGIYLGDSSNNTIYHNNFVNNVYNAYETKNNSWYYGLLGNYWDDYDESEGVYNITGGTSQDVHPMTDYINELPVADFSYSPTAPSTQDLIGFLDMSIDSDGYITSWYWSFGDEDNSSLENPTHNYGDNGIYTVTLEITDDLGEKSTLSKEIIVLNVAPTADLSYSPSSPTDLNNISFSDESVDLDGYIASWSWDFGDGNSSNQKNTSHMYADDGIYDLTLTVGDDDGASATITEKITVTNVAPSADFSYTPKNPTNNDTISFSDSSKDMDGKIISWTWDLGDGTTYTAQNPPDHSYSYGGNYKVTLTVVDDDGSTSTSTKNIKVAEEATIHEDYAGWVVVIIVFITIFVGLIGAVYYIYKKYERKY